MIKYINEKKNLPWRRIPNNLCRYSILKGKQHKSPLFKHGLHVLNSFQKEQYVKDNKNNLTGLPWWLSGKESACQCRRRGFNPWWGKIPHASEQVSPRIITVELVLSSLEAATTEALTPWSPYSAIREPLQWEAITPQLESSSCAPQLKKAGAAMKTQHRQK